MSVVRQINGKKGKWTLNSIYVDNLKGGKRREKEYAENFNKKDIHNTRSLRLTEAKILRLAKYYRSNNVIPADWKYSLSNAKLLVG